MRKIIVLTAALVFLLGLAMATPAAAQEDKQAKLEAVKLVLDTLRLKPLSYRICILHERYAAAQELEYVVENPEINKLVDIKQVVSLQFETAGMIVGALISRLSSGEWPHSEKVDGCSYQVPFGTLSTHHLMVQDDYTIVKVLEDFFLLYPQLQRETGIDDYNIRLVMVRVCEREGPRLKKDRQSNDSKTSEQATFMLYQCMVKYQIAPSVSGLSAEEAGRILEEGGRKKESD